MTKPKPKPKTKKEKDIKHMGDTEADSKMVDLNKNISVITLKLNEFKNLKKNEDINETEKQTQDRENTANICL